jgi:hypothetical protein
MRSLAFTRVREIAVRQKAPHVILSFPWTHLNCIARAIARGASFSRSNPVFAV